MTIKEALNFFENIRLEGNQKQISSEVLKEIRSRLGFLVSVGLNYLTLDRLAPTLSGGKVKEFVLQVR